MHVDAAGQDVLPGRVDGPVGVNVGEAAADERDLLVFDQYVTAVLIDRGDYGAVGDERAHGARLVAYTERSRAGCLSLRPRSSGRDIGAAGSKSKQTPARTSG